MAAIATYATNDTDLVIDVNGYFAASGSGGLSFYALTPCRVIDTRNVGNGQPFSGELTVDVQTSPCGPPATSPGLRLQRDRGAAMERSAS